jgi:hypothetical protein
MAVERKLERVAGVADSAVVRRGTASEHRAVVLTTDAGERLILQRIGGNAFSDEPTDRLAGQLVSVLGFRLGDIFRYLEASASPAPGGSPPGSPLAASPRGRRRARGR